VAAALKGLRNRLLARPTVALCARWPAQRALRTMRRVNGIQLSAAELRVIARVLKRRVPCRLLVFGCGNDAAFWLRVNARGRTEFIEDDAAWAQECMRRNPGMVVHLVSYDSQRSQWRALLHGPAEDLAMTLPESIAATRWDAILVDAPAGWSDATPGRMKSIFTACRLAAAGADVFVHDCDREVERAFCDRFFTPRQRVTEVGRLRHYRTD
jgi:glucuronoxylan 4-O-methyltransferase